jgi:type II secretory pathway pseudopilin PulG
VHPEVEKKRRSSTPECRRGSEAGDTLLEVLIAIVVLALASLALIVGFGTSISSSAEHRDLATFDSVLATTSQEAISLIQQQQSLFQTCPSSPAVFYQTENASGQPLFLNIPSPYTSQYTVTFTAVSYWDSANGIYDASCVVNGYQAQLITITVTEVSTGVSYTNSFVVDYPSASAGASLSGTAAQLVFYVEPGPSTMPYTAAGIPLGVQPVVKVEDGSSIPVTTDLSPVTLSLSGGTSGATLTGCSGNEILGVITFTGCTVNLAGTGYIITATDGSLPPGSQTATSDPFNVDTSAPALVFVSGTPVAGASGSAFTTQPVVQVQNNGVPDTTWTGTISLTSSGGVLSGCTNLTITVADAGVANVANCSFEGGYVYNPVSNVTLATVYTLTATASGVASGTSGAFSVTSAGLASQLVFSTQPTGVASLSPATPFTVQPAVTVEDAFGNAVTSGYAPTISITAISVGTLAGCTSTNANGITTFSGCYGSTYGNGITVTATASSGGLSVKSAPFNITRAASILVFTTQPVAGVSGTDFLTEPVLAEEDSLGNIVTSSTAQVTLTPSAGGSLSFCSGLTPVNGVVSASSCNFAGVVGITYTITASALGLTSATSNGFKVTSPGAATSLVFTTQPVAGASGSPFTTEPVLAVQDSGGNVVTTANVTVTLTPLGGTLSSCTGLTAVAGVVDVANCTFAGVVGMHYTLTASATGLISAISNPFWPSGPGPASQIVLTGCSLSVLSGTTCTVSANIEDNFDNLETAYNSSVAFAQTSGSGSVTGLAAETAVGGVASDTLTGLNWGPVVIDASGDAVISNPMTVQVVGITSTSIVSNANPADVGQQVTYTATVSLTSPGGGSPPATDTVAFMDGGTPIAGCTAQPLTGTSPDTATCQVTYADTTGSPHSISAVFSGDANFATSTSAPISQTINQSDTAVALTSSVNPAVTGQTVTYTGTVSATSPGLGSPTGNVEFFDGGTAIAACGGISGEPLSGTSPDTATCIDIYSVAGSYAITAQYLGDVGTYNASALSSALSETLNQGPTATAVTSSMNPSVMGQQVTYTATVTAAPPSTGNPTGNVEFFDGGTAITGCTAQALNGSSPDTATCLVTYNSTGSHSITAQYLGNGGTFGASAPSAPMTQVVNLAATTTSVSSSANPSDVGQQVIYTATVTVVSPGTGNPTGSVEFFDGVTAITGCTALSLPGTSTDTVTCAVTYANTTGSPHSITAQYQGNPGTYATSTSGALSQVVSQAPTTVSVASNQNPSVNYQHVTYTATVTATSPGTGNPTGTVEFFDAGTAIAGCTAQAVTFTSTDTAACQATYNTTGSHVITVQYLGNPGTYNPSALSPSITQVVNASSSYAGNSTGNLSSTANYYLINGPSGGSITSTDNSYSSGVATTLTSLTFTISGPSATSQTAVLGLIAGSSWSPTGLTCTIAGGSNLTSCQIVVSVSVLATDYTNIEVVGGVDAITGSWTTTYTEP